MMKNHQVVREKNLVQAGHQGIRLNQDILQGQDHLQGQGFQEVHQKGKIVMEERRNQDMLPEESKSA